MDEPTNHLDIVGKETLEHILKNFSGTVIFVSHDRYFIKEISDSLLVFEPSGVKFLPYGYSQYLEMQNSVQVQEIKEEKPKLKKTYTTPLKEIGKKERAVKKEEEKNYILLLRKKLQKIMIPYVVFSLASFGSVIVPESDSVLVSFKV